MMTDRKTLRQRLGLIGLIVVMMASMLAVVPSGDASALPPPNTAASCKRLSHTASGLVGGSHHCYYAVTGMADWRSWCDGRGGTWSLARNCRNVAGGWYKVDVWKTDPWTRQSSYVNYKLG